MILKIVLSVICLVLVAVIIVLVQKLRAKNGVVEMIKEFKGIDIVKCKDCKYFKPHGNTGFCDKAVALLGELNPDNYCSYGERK